MFNDSELKRIETNLAHLERDRQELEKAGLLIRKHAEERIESIRRDMERDLDHKHREMQNKDRELEKAKADRTRRQEQLQEEFNKANKR